MPRAHPLSSPADNGDHAASAQERLRLVVITPQHSASSYKSLVAFFLRKTCKDKPTVSSPKSRQLIETFLQHREYSLIASWSQTSLDDSLVALSRKRVLSRCPRIHQAPRGRHPTVLALVEHPGAHGESAAQVFGKHGGGHDLPALPDAHDVSVDRRRVRPAPILPDLFLDEVGSAEQRR
ncbi:hypothetical protein BS47DRAFT_1481074 [Hydnum rufescens UP504]|uniref:Uncharacterized protein n=1 Tax=Hydnum rufescens UP504 TaxID=1448309 RepID=A0A9P6E037_9AGAM|nr:hypothetical protein BS47DRAFT_1481074 [Hydnum rufescens UP504]